MLLAHLRGLLRPYYSQGAKSVVAETAMLRTLTAEIYADFERSRLQAQAAFSPLLTADAAQEMYTNVLEGFSTVIDKAMLEFSRAPSNKKKTMEGMVSLLNELDRKGFFTRLNEATEKALRETGWKRD